MNQSGRTSSQLILGIGRENEYPKLVSKFWGLLPKKFAGVKSSPNFAIFRLFRPFLQNGARYRQSKNGFLIYGIPLPDGEEMVYFCPA